jgi:hypothetical protein
MSLPAAQQRILDGIADGLRRTEPRLAAMYAMFTRLCFGDGPPMRERLARRRNWPLIAAVGALSGGLRRRHRGAWRLVLIATQVAIAIVLLAIIASLSWRQPADCSQPGRHRAVAPVRLWCPAQAAAYGLPGR